MYKKCALLSALLGPATTYATPVVPLLEIKPSYFFFSSSPMRKVYHKGGVEIQGCASIPVCTYSDVYGSVGYRHAKGHALNADEKTSLTVIPIDIGLKPVFNFYDRFYSFFAIGPRFFYFHQHNNSPYVDRIINGEGVGLFANTGFNALLADCLLLGIFGEYSYEKKAVIPKKPRVYSNGKVQLGGFAFGISVGYAF